MALTSGSRIGPYEVIAPLGAGGMGEVYRARDTVLERDVALKILPGSFATDPDRLARFEREARTLASLNHPHIAQVYGLVELPAEAGSSPGALHTRALVMELVEGDDLSALMSRGPMALADALPIARQIAEALEAAHDAGIVHRDLKPANIKVRADGTVKVLDFGLAKALAPSGISATPDALDSPTMASPVTALGLIVGTVAYMAPEQARGKAVDRRADVWAFGVVLYEMLTGRRAFDGDEMSDVLAAVLRQPIDWAALPAETPAPVRRLLRRCLERERSGRLADMSAVRLEIAEALTGSAETLPGGPAAGSRPARRRLWMAVSAGLALVSVTLAFALWRTFGPDRTAMAGDAPVVRFALVDDPRVRVNIWSTQPFATSRDASTLVFSADAGSGVRLWVRTLDQPDPRPLADTEGAYQPAISPDGEWVAFVVANHLIRKVRLGGGGATTVASIDDVTAALAWASNDSIIFEKIGSGSGLHRVNANGGSPELLVPLDAAAGEQGHRRPFVLREQRLLLYASSAKGGRRSLGVFSLDDGRRGRLEIDGIQVLGIIDGHLVYSRSDGSLMAVPFDAPGLRVVGAPRQLADRVSTSQFGTAVALSESGTLVAAPPVPPALRLMLGDAAGKAVPVGDSVRAFDSPRFSPDARRIAVVITESEGQDLWVFDKASASATRVIRGGSNRLELQNWTSDGKALVYIRDSELWITPVDVTAEPRRLVQVEGRVTGASIMPDGRSVVVTRRIGGGQGLVDREELVRVRLDGDGAVAPVLASRSSGETMRPVQPRVSPDGRWVAFQDRNERQIHVRSADGTTGMQVSDAGGTLPVWGGDNRLFYQTSAGLMAADLQATPTAGVLRRTLLPAFPSSGVVHDLSTDGKTFLVVAPVDPALRVMVTINWATVVRRQLSNLDK